MNKIPNTTMCRVCKKEAKYHSRAPQREDDEGYDDFITVNYKCPNGHITARKIPGN